MFFWFGFAERTLDPKMLQIQNSSHLVSLSIQVRRNILCGHLLGICVSTWKLPVRPVETTSLNQGPLGPISLPFYMPPGSRGRSQENKELESSVTAYDDKEVSKSFSPMVPLLVLTERKEADGHSSDASWMWSKFWLATFAYIHWVQTKAEREQDETQFFHLTMSGSEGRHPSGSSINSTDQSWQHQMPSHVSFPGSPHEEHHLSTWRGHERPNSLPAPLCILPNPPQVPLVIHIISRTFTLGQLPLVYLASRVLPSLLSRVKSGHVSQRPYIF